MYVRGRLNGSVLSLKRHLTIFPFLEVKGNIAGGKRESGVAD